MAITIEKCVCGNLPVFTVCVNGRGEPNNEFTLECPNTCGQTWRGGIGLYQTIDRWNESIARTRSNPELQAIDARKQFERGELMNEAS